MMDFKKTFQNPQAFGEPIKMSQKRCGFLIPWNSSSGKMLHTEEMEGDEGET